MRDNANASPLVPLLSASVVRVRGKLLGPSLLVSKGTRRTRVEDGDGRGGGRVEERVAWHEG